MTFTRMHLLAALLLLAPLPASAQPNMETRAPSAAQLGQQQRMRDCNATAHLRSLQGEARRGFMRECLAGREATGLPGPLALEAPSMAQQHVLRGCTVQATQRGLDGGPDYRAFMRACQAGTTPPHE